MVMPFVVPWVEQCHNCSGFTVDSRQIWAFAEIASRAAKREIWKFVGTAVLLRNDVVDMEAGKRQCRLWQSAVFAAITRPLLHVRSKLFVH